MKRQEQKQNYAPFIAAWKKRFSDQRKQREALRKEAYQEAKRCAEILRQEYGAKRVFLFGSVLDEDRFSERSDIDLAVEGLEGSSFFGAVGKLLQESKFNIGMVPWEDCQESFKRKILTRGELLYESSQPKSTKTSEAKERNT